MNRRRKVLGFSVIELVVVLVIPAAVVLLWARAFNGPAHTWAEVQAALTALKEQAKTARGDRAEVKYGYGPKWLVDAWSWVYEHTGFELCHHSRVLWVKELKIPNATNLRNADLAHFDMFSQMRVLHLKLLRVDASALEHIGNLSELEELVLGFSQIGDKGLAHIGKLRNLRPCWPGRAVRRQSPDGL